MLVFVLGLQQSEVLGLTWDRVHLNAQVPFIEVRQQLARDLTRHGCVPEGRKPTCGRRSANVCPQQVPGKGLYIRPVLKTRLGKRNLPIPSDLKWALIEHKERWDVAREYGWVRYTYHQGGTDEILRLDWKPQEGEGLDNLVFVKDDATPISHQDYTKRWNALCQMAGIQHQRQHLNRHITATLLAEKGVPPATARLVLGHSSERMAEYYTHLNTVQTTQAPLEALAASLVPSMDIDTDRAREVVEAVSDDPDEDVDLATVDINFDDLLDPGI